MERLAMRQVVPLDPFNTIQGKIRFQCCVCLYEWVSRPEWCSAAKGAGYVPDALHRAHARSDPPAQADAGDNKRAYRGARVVAGGRISS